MRVDIPVVSHLSSGVTLPVQSHTYEPRVFLHTKPSSHKVFDVSWHSSMSLGGKKPKTTRIEIRKYTKSTTSFL